jgi:hypothetical protein
MMTPVHRTKKQPRAPRKFSIQQEVRYESLGKKGNFGVGKGTSFEVSTEEVWFTTEQDLLRGQRIRLAMNWPVLLNDTCRLQLQICGRIFHTQRGQAALQVKRYEFRTLSTHKSDAAEAASASPGRTPRTLVWDREDVPKFAFWRQYRDWPSR